jgi:hypothetical protein
MDATRPALDNALAAPYRAGANRALPLLDNIRVATPCEASWDAMRGNGRVRLCTKCSKKVFNLSAMSRADAEVLVRKHAGAGLCVRFYRRLDGTVMTNDCPVGVRARRVERSFWAVLVATVLGGAAARGLGLEPYGTREECKVGTEFQGGTWGE